MLRKIWCWKWSSGKPGRARKLIPKPTRTRSQLPSGNYVSGTGINCSCRNTHAYSRDVCIPIPPKSIADIALTGREKRFIELCCRIDRLYITGEARPRSKCRAICEVRSSVRSHGDLEISRSSKRMSRPSRCTGIINAAWLNNLSHESILTPQSRR